MYEAPNVPEAEREATVETEPAISLYDRGIRSFGEAGAPADRSERGRHRLLCDRHVARHYTRDELDEDIEYARR